MSELKQQIKQRGSSVTWNPEVLPGQHYHITSGLTGGYMPDNNEICRTRLEAENCIKFVVQQLRGNEPRHRRTEGEIFYGQAHKGFYISKDGSYYAQIEVCYDVECLQELETEEEY